MIPHENDEACRAIQSADRALGSIPTETLLTHPQLRVAVQTAEGDLIEAWVALGGQLTSDDQIPPWTAAKSDETDRRVHDAKDVA